MMLLAGRCLLSGRCRVTDHARGAQTERVLRETCFRRDGARVRWTIFETVTKVYYGRKADGY